MEIRRITVRQGNHRKQMGIPMEARRKWKYCLLQARLVAQDFSQKPGTDYSSDGTFALVMRFETLRTLLALGAVNNWKIQQFNIKGAYLHGTLHETIYMRQPEGFNDGSGHVCRLIRPLYGLKQSGNVWNEEFTSTMTSMGFTQLKTDYCCFI